MSHGFKMLSSAVIIGMLMSASFESVIGQDPTVFLTIRGTQTSTDIGSQEILLPPLSTQPARPVVTALAASSDGKILAAAGDDHSIRIIDVPLKNERRPPAVTKTLLGHSDWIRSLAFAGNSQTLFSAGTDGRVILWDWSQTEQPIELLQLPYALRSISVSSQRELLAIGGFSNEVIIFDLPQRKIRFRLACNSQDQRCVQFSPDGMHVLCGGRDGRLMVWRTEDGTLLAQFHEHIGRVQTAAFSADGWQVTSAGEDGQIIRYDLQSEKITRKHNLDKTKLMSLCMINDDFVAVAGADNSIHLYDAVADDVIADLDGHFGSVATMCACGENLASGSFDTTIRIWDLEMIAEQMSYVSKPVSRTPIEMDSRLRIR